MLCCIEWESVKKTVCYKYVRDKSGRAIPTFGKVGSGRDLPSRLFSKVGSGRDWPSRTLKIVEVSREKSREVRKSRGNPDF